jgi:hypothetical protein
LSNCVGAAWSFVRSTNPNAERPRAVKREAFAELPMCGF